MARHQAARRLGVLTEGRHKIGIDPREGLIGRREQYERALTGQIIEHLRQLDQAGDQRQRGLRGQHIGDIRRHRRRILDLRRNRRRDDHTIGCRQRLIDRGCRRCQRGIDNGRPTRTTRPIGLHPANAS